MEGVSFEQQLPPPWGQDPVLLPPPSEEPAAVVGGDWINDEELPLPPRLLAWAEKERDGQRLSKPSGRLILGAAAAVVLLMVVIAV